MVGKKIIEFGTDEPNTTFLRAHITEMEKLSFDGVVFHLSGPNFTWELWGKRRFKASDFEKSLDELRATKFHRFTDRFLRVNVTPGDVDWFDDAAWKVVLANFGVAAKIAKDTGCKGFLFDTEQYQGSLFYYPEQKLRAKKTFAEYQAKVRQRGREWITEVDRAFPDITMLITFGYEYAQPRKGKKDRSQEDYGLLPDFFDGVLSACSNRTRLVQAWEPSYGFKTEKRFDKAYELSTVKGLEWTAEKEKYKRHTSVGFGLWMDNISHERGWDMKNFSKNYFTPAEFEAALRFALLRSDEYVWIYAGRPRWWTNELVPKAYLDALTKARKPAAPAKSH